MEAPPPHADINRGETRLKTAENNEMAAPAAPHHHYTHHGGRGSGGDRRSELRRQLADIGRRLLDYAYLSGARGGGDDPVHRFLTAGGALGAKQKRLIALSIAVANRHGGSMAYHVREALLAGAAEEEILEAIGIAVRMAGGPSTSHAAHAEEAVRLFREGAAEYTAPAPV
jgi:AhpD family alkylhydroperoxidase